MQPGAVIIDLASEGGGNCELTKPGEIYQHEGVVICGELNVPAQLAVHASEMFSKNLFNFISPWLKDAQLVVDWEDEIISQSCLVKEGEVVNSRIQTLLGGGA